MEWSFKNGIPLYTQIINEMTMRIASGLYKPGEKLPSVRDLAMDAGVNPNTMQRALAELERNGLVFSERTNGRYVTEEEIVLKSLHEKLARQYFTEFIQKLSKIGLTEDEIRNAVHRWLTESKK